MKERIELEILPQPDDRTCGPTCLQAVYNYFGDNISLEEVIRDTARLENGGTLAVNLACHALQRGYNAAIYTYNLQFFDPTWFSMPDREFVDRLKKQAENKSGRRLKAATQSYLEYLSLGGKLKFEDLDGNLIRKYLKKGIPILTGLSSTYLYGESRELESDDQYDDVRGVPVGHFVVLSGYDQEKRSVEIADPFHTNPVSGKLHYRVDVSRLICSILLGVLTYDANLLIIQPGKENMQ